MPASISFNPSITTVGQGLFADASAAGLTQGTAFPDPSTRWALRSGVLDATETLPMWGGVGIYEHIPVLNTTGPNSTLGISVGRATALTGTKALTGFSVFDQAYGMITTPQSTVPLIGSYGQVMTYRLGSGARLAVACDPNLVSLRGGSIDQQVSWDFVNQILVPFVNTTVSSGTYTSGTGAVTLTTAAAHGLLPGDTFVLSGATGTGAFANLNGTQVTTTGTAGTTLNFTAATGLTLTITGGTISNGGALNVEVLEVSTTNNMTVVYNSGTGFANWDYSGSAALIQI